MKKTIQSKSILAFVLLIAGFVVSCSKGNNSSEPKEPRMSIHEATFMGNTKVVQAHLDFGSDLNVKDEYGSTPLNIAVTFGKDELAKMLINGGADLSVLSADGSTILHTAAFFGRREVVQAILEKGIDTQVRNNYGTTAMESIMIPFEQVKMIYDQMARDLAPLGLRLDYDRLKAVRPEIVEMIAAYDKAQN